MQDEERQDESWAAEAELEARLREGLERRRMPVGLEARIVAAAERQRLTTTARRRGLLRMPLGVRGLAGRGWALQRIAASVALGGVVAGVAAYYQAEQRTEQRRRAEAAQAQQASAQVMEALRIASRTLDRVQVELNDGQ